MNLVNKVLKVTDVRMTNIILLIRVCFYSFTLSTNELSEEHCWYEFVLPTGEHDNRMKSVETPNYYNNYILTLNISVDLTWQRRNSHSGGRQETGDVRVWDF